MDGSGGKLSAASSTPASPTSPSSWVVWGGTAAAVLLSSAAAWWWIRRGKGSTMDEDVRASIAEARALPRSQLPGAVMTGESRAVMVPVDASAVSPDTILLPTSFVEQYELRGVMGTGLTSTVVAAVHRESGTECAVKIIEKAKLQPGMLAYIDREVRIMKQLDHPNIVRMLDVMHTSTHVLVVMERALGGELYDRLARQTYNEADARTVTHSLVSALMYLHSKGILHRDVKPENLLLAAADSLTDIKLCDFGLAKWFGEAAATDPASPPPRAPPKLCRASTVCGSELYHAPEVTTGDYSFPCDFYSVGVILHFMLVGFVPDSPDEELFVDVEWEPVSAAAKDLVAQLLDTNPATRITGPAILAHPWMQTRALPERPLLAAQASMKDMYVKPRAQQLRQRSHVHRFLDSLGRSLAVPPRSEDDPGVAAAASPHGVQATVLSAASVLKERAAQRRMPSVGAVNPSPS